MPVDQYRCRYGKWGRLGRALVDSLVLTMHKFVASFVVLLFSVIMSTVVIVRDSSDSALCQALTVIIGLTAGVSAGLAVIALWTLSPSARQYHWRSGSERLGPENRGHTLLVLKSNHWHPVSKMRCTVTDPMNVKWTATWDRDERLPLILAPGDYKAFDYPKDYNAPWPIVGLFRVKWQMDAVGRQKPITLVRHKWQVVD